MIFNMTFHRFLRRPSIAACLCCLMILIALPARAQSLLRDADIEFGLKQIAAPVLRAAGLSPNRVKILVVNDSSLNAFVISNDAIFIHYGLINKLTRTDMLQGIIAHEAAHITNGPCDRNPRCRATCIFKTHKVRRSISRSIRRAVFAICRHPRPRAC
jgi:Zn-dependent protease with chaperone function